MSCTVCGSPSQVILGSGRFPRSSWFRRNRQSTPFPISVGLALSKAAMGRPQPEVNQGSDKVWHCGQSGHRQPCSTDYWRDLGSQLPGNRDRAERRRNDGRSPGRESTKAIPLVCTSKGRKRSLVCRRKNRGRSRFAHWGFRNRSGGERLDFHEVEILAGPSDLRNYAAGLEIRCPCGALLLAPEILQRLEYISHRTVHL